MDDFDREDRIFSPKKKDIDDRIQLCTINIGKVLMEGDENRMEKRKERMLKMLEGMVQEYRSFGSRQVLMESEEERKEIMLKMLERMLQEYRSFCSRQASEREETLEVIQQAIASLERKETLRKEKLREYNSLTVMEKAVVDLKERYSMSTTPGFKFQPNDEEIIRHLEIKRSNPCQTPSWSPIKDCPGFYGTHPGRLPDANGIKEKKALYYYVRTKKKSESGDRTNHSGCWRASGNNKVLSETGSEIGYKRTLKYREYPDDENKKFSKFAKSTNWMMHEYGIATTTSSQSQEESLEHWTICKVTWTGKNIEVTNDFSREGSIGPSENKHKNKLTMHTQNEGDLKISKIVDSKREEIAQTNDHSIGDEFRRWTQEIRGKLTEQRMNREIHQSEEVTPCHASGINSTLMATTHEVETKGLEPRQFENPGKITEEFGTYISEQTSESWFDRLLNSDFIGWEEENQCPSISEQTSASWGDCFLNPDVTGSSDENQS